jgi:hypothetical protein
MGWLSESARLFWPVVTKDEVSKYKRDEHSRLPISEIEESCHGDDQYNINETELYPHATEFNTALGASEGVQRGPGHFLMPLARDRRQSPV